MDMLSVAGGADELCGRGLGTARKPYITSFSRHSKVMVKRSHARSLFPVGSRGGFFFVLDRFAFAFPVGWRKSRRRGLETTTGSGPSCLDYGQGWV